MKTNQISSNVFFRIVFEEFYIDVSHFDVGYDDFLADGGQSRRVLEERLVLETVCNRGQKLDGVRRQHVILDLQKKINFPLRRTITKFQKCEKYK